MKRSSPSTQNSPSSSSSSSSSSSVSDDQPLELTTTKPKRPRKRAPQCTPKPIPNPNPNPPNSSRRSSIYRGVTRHRWTGRFEAHLWDKSSFNTTQNKKGKQVYLGAYDCEEDAARTYDLAALKYWGPSTILNFQSEGYTKELEEMHNVSKEEYLASLRRCSSGFSRGVSKYRGVAKHHHNGRWEARIGRVFGNKYLYLGTFSSQEEAAKAYDLAAIQYRGRNAVTNFDINNYIPKEEKPTTLVVEATPEFVNDEDNKEKVQQELKEAAVLYAMTEVSEESELANAFNESPVLVMDEPEQNDYIWSFSLDDDEGGYDDPLLVPHILQEEAEEDGGMLDFLDQKAFVDDIDLIFDNEAIGQYLENSSFEGGGCELMKEREVIEKSAFELSSSDSSSSTVTSDLF